MPDLSLQFEELARAGLGRRRRVVEARTGRTSPSRVAATSRSATTTIWASRIIQRSSKRHAAGGAAPWVPEHALLTQEAIEAEGLKFAGWVANRIDPAMARAEENIEALRRRLRAPLVAECRSARLAIFQLR